MEASGKAFKYGDNVDTDVIIPARYLNSSEPVVLAAHCMEDIDRDFAANARPGDIVAGLKNFGCGSSREHAPLALKASGVSCVIAKTFARIFYRNAINIGLPILECPEAAESIQNGDQISIDFETGVISNLTRNETYKAEPFPPFMREIIEAGGLVNRTRRTMGVTE
ncbi:MAG: 3-isopropylmalate dehydratase small subunit [Clostridiales bacterium]|jgi:3-isopropylmalate/(R)-2-methylmalate dehydratase small subunit|nr:3-isopropylmalate dehydratase small subunit [Clostridiales bacterium]